jgi:hypothetical protein
VKIDSVSLSIRVEFESKKEVKGARCLLLRTMNSSPPLAGHASIKPISGAPLEQTLQTRIRATAPDHGETNDVNSLSKFTSREQALQILNVEMVYSGWIPSDNKDLYLDHFDNL